MRNRIIPILAIVTLAAVAINSRDDDTIGGVDIPIVYFDGTSGNVSDFRGTPVVLNFWASWCPACVAELPDFERIHQEFGNAVVFIGINMQEVDPTAADALISETGVTYRLAADPDGAIYRSFSGIAMPTSIFITADGVVADVHAGAIFAEDLRAVIRQELLAP